MLTIKGLMFVGLGLEVGGSGSRICPIGVEAFDDERDEEFISKREPLKLGGSFL